MSSSWLGLSTICWSFSFAHRLNVEVFLWSYTLQSLSWLGLNTVWSRSWFRYSLVSVLIWSWFSLLCLDLVSTYSGLNVDFVSVQKCIVFLFWNVFRIVCGNGIILQPNLTLGSRIKTAGLDYIIHYTNTLLTMLWSPVMCPAFQPYMLLKHATSYISVSKWATLFLVKCNKIFLSICKFRSIFSSSRSVIYVPAFVRIPRVKTERSSWRAYSAVDQSRSKAISSLSASSNLFFCSLISYTPQRWPLFAVTRFERKRLSNWPFVPRVFFLTKHWGISI